MTAPAAPATNAAPSAPKAVPKREAGPQSGSTLPLDSDVQRIVDDRTATYRDTVGLVVGVIDPSGRRLNVRGPSLVGNDDPVDGDTIFEIGSISKVFTALLLSDMARRGELSLNDPVEKYLPANTKLPQRRQSMTLLDLATHMSGLPKTLSNVAVTDFNNPNADMTQDQFLRSVQTYDLPRDVGAAYEYSNAGYQLLGLALADAGHADLESLLRNRILAPLHLDSTWISISAAEKDRSAGSYDEHLSPVPHPRLPALLGSEGMRSTANDLLDFLAANIGLKATPLAPAMADMIKLRRSTQYAELKAAIGWHVATLHGVEIIWHNGQTDGSRAFIGFAPMSRTGVVVLSNSANTIDDIGVHLLDPQTPLRALHREVPVNPGQFQNYIGRYAVSETFALEITQDGSRLFIQGPGQPRAELFAETADKYFLRVVDGEVVFQTDGNGHTRGLQLTQDGKTVSALRIR
jgi:CubicO group peptidase (beta-lactamase class C family)